METKKACSKRKCSCDLRKPTKNAGIYRQEIVKKESISPTEDDKEKAEKA